MAEKWYGCQVQRELLVLVWAIHGRGKKFLNPLDPIIPHCAAQRMNWIMCVNYYELNTKRKFKEFSNAISWRRLKDWNRSDFEHTQHIFFFFQKYELIETLIKPHVTRIIELFIDICIGFEIKFQCQFKVENRWRFFFWKMENCWKTMYFPRYPSLHTKF